jgi:energy-converting hydrogenase B subunit Q
MGAAPRRIATNIRGERISVDTIPLVGEENLAGAVRAVRACPRAVALILAGAMMGGDVARAVPRVRARAIVVVSLNMAERAGAGRSGRQRPVQAGVMTVMRSPHATFDVARVVASRF